MIIITSYHQQQYTCSLSSYEPCKKPPTNKFNRICHFRPMTQPNPLKIQILDPLPTQPKPWINPADALWVKQPVGIRQDDRLSDAILLLKGKPLGWNATVLTLWMCSVPSSDQFSQRSRSGSMQPSRGWQAVKYPDIVSGQCWNWPKITGREWAAEMFEILPRDWNLKPIFT